MSFAPRSVMAQGEVDQLAFSHHHSIPSGDALIMLNFSPDFISEWSDGSGTRANISNLADHADYLGRLAGRSRIGIGSDFDGIAKVRGIPFLVFIDSADQRTHGADSSRA